MAGPKPKAQREERLGANDWVADLVKNATKAAVDSATLAQQENQRLTLALRDEQENTARANKRTEDAEKRCIELSKQIGELQRADLEREKWITQQSILRVQLENQGNRDKALWETVRSIGEVVVKSAVVPRLMGPPTETPTDAPAEHDSSGETRALAITMVEIFHCLSDGTKTAIAMEAGTEKVQRLISLLQTATKPATKESEAKAE